MNTIVSRRVASAGITDRRTARAPRQNPGMRVMMSPRVATRTTWTWRIGRKPPLLGARLERRHDSADGWSVVGLHDDLIARTERRRFG